MDGASLATVLAAIGGAVATGFFAWAAQKAAARAAVRNAELTSHTDLAKQVGEEARAYWSGVIDDQNRRIASKDQEVRDVRVELRDVRTELDEAKARIETLEDRLESAEELAAAWQKRAHLAESNYEAAQKLIARFIPDE